jgi:hypothetical protein
MPCSCCRESGHNIRTCPRIAMVAEETRDMAIEEAAAHVAEQLGEEVCVEIIEFGLDMAMPGAGRLAQACRLAYKMS